MSRITNYIKHKLMSFRNIFKDKNDINEKNVFDAAKGKKRRGRPKKK